jgi:hypothetical protein
MKLTPSQKILMDVLADGKPHGRRELLLALGDPDQKPAVISVFLHGIREALREETGDEILCIRGKYQRVKIVPYNQAR